MTSQTTFSRIVLSPELQALAGRWINFHRVLWVLTLVIFLIAWNRGLALLYGLFSLLVALLAISYVLPGLQLRQIRVTRRSIGCFTAGRQGDIIYTLASARPRHHVELVESLPFADEPHPHLFFDRVSGQTSAKLRFKCLKRGVYRLRDCELSCAYPFGIKRFSRRLPADPLDILVLPRVVSLARIPLPPRARPASWGDVRLPQKGGPDEFTGVREYSRGDALNRVHWPATARHRSLVVKMYEKTDRPAMLVVLPCNRSFDIGRGHRTTFEYSITIAASMIRRAIQEGLACYLAVPEDPLRVLTVQPYTNDLFPLYEFLARLHSDSRHPYPSVVEQAHRRFPQANLVTTFRLATDPARYRLSPDVTQIDIELDGKSFEAPQTPRPTAGKGSRQEGNRMVVTVHADSQLEALFL